MNCSDLVLGITYELIKLFIKIILSLPNIKNDIKNSIQSSLSTSIIIRRVIKYKSMYNQIYKILECIGPYRTTFCVTICEWDVTIQITNITIFSKPK